MNKHGTERREPSPPPLDWIPWRRYALVLNIDDDRDVFLGRFRFKKSCEREAARLSQYKGYKPAVIDTKTVRRESVKS